MVASHDPTKTEQFGRIACFAPWLRPLVGNGRPFSAKEVAYKPKDGAASALDAIVGVRSVSTDNKAYHYAKRHGLPYVPAELGVYVSVRGGKRARPCSVIIDRRPNLEPTGSMSVVAHIVETQVPEILHEQERAGNPSHLLNRAKRIREYIVTEKLSRHADGLVDPRVFLESAAALPIIVVVPNQCHGDTRCCCGSSSALSDLLDAARSEHPNAPIWLLREVEPITGVTSEVPATILADRGLRVLPLNVDRGQLLEHAQQVYTHCSPFGFEALLRSILVNVFGSPFYAGFGLTSDRLPGVSKNRPCSLDVLVASAILLAPRYYDPVRECETTPEEALEYLALQRRHFLENRGAYTCVGLSLWKRTIVKRYLESPENQIRFVRDAASLEKASPARDSHLVVWASRPHDDIQAYAEKHGQSLIRVEDGFLRSVGLGSDWSAPGSLVFDSSGIYYDPRQRSSLEQLLETAEFSEAELVQAESLRELLLSLRLSKYNTHQEREFLPNCRPGQKVILVPGQVADDASVRFGGSAIGGVRELLQAVRESEPDAYILYKPHPDVISGNRKGHIDEGRGTWFDELVVDVPIARCLERVDAVHTISSLVGFEALLRGLPVTCHGQPFFAGWGLTTDRQPIERRTRKLTLPMLIAGVLGRYPRYYHFPSGTFCSAAQMANVIASQKRAQRANVRAPKLLRKLRSLFQLARDISHAR